MRIVLFYHSLISDWNHGNAHFLRGVVGDLLRRGIDVVVYEPIDGWSATSLRRHHGDRPLRAFRRAFPALQSIPYDECSLDLDAALASADAVIVHEWNTARLAARIAAHREKVSPEQRYALLFHDTHHRIVSNPTQMAAYDLRCYDGVLAFGEIIRCEWLERGWAKAAWTWHEAADTETYVPAVDTAEAHHQDDPPYDLIWVGNWGDDERTEELIEFMIEPIERLGLRAKFHGVRYPREAQDLLRKAGIEYGGYLPAHEVPATLHQCRFTVHVPRRPYVERIHGVPTIRVFEALACGTPLICSPWFDTEKLFTPGRDYLVVQDGEAMNRAMQNLIDNPARARSLAAHGRSTIQRRHTCRHRVNELLGIIRSVLDAREIEPASERDAAPRVRSHPHLSPPRFGRSRVTSVPHTAIHSSGGTGIVDFNAAAATPQASSKVK